MRQLKQFLRNRKKEMLACGDCECRTLKCWREASCECVIEPVPPTPTTYTITFAVTPAGYGTVSSDSITVEEGASISVSDNVLTIGETEVTATAESGYEFTSWGTLPATVTENLSITATFSAVTPPASGFNIIITSSTGNIYNDNEELQELPVIVGFNEGDEVTAWASADSFSMSWNEGADLTVYGAFPFEGGDEFSHWEMDGVPMEDEAEVTITSTTTITAVFGTPLTVQVSVMEGQELYGSVSDSSVEVAEGTQITTSGNTVTIGNTTITATANQGYEFDGWLIFAGMDDYVTEGADNTVVAKFREVL